MKTLVSVFAWWRRTGRAPPAEKGDGWKTEAPLKEKWKTGLKEGTKQKEVANKKTF